MDGPEAEVFVGVDMAKAEHRRSTVDGAEVLAGGSTTTRPISS